MTIEDFEWMVEDMRKAKARAKGAVRRTLYEAEQDAVVERELVRGKLEKQWCLPEYSLSAEQVDKCIETLQKYERWSDAIYDARRLISKERVEV